MTYRSQEASAIPNEADRVTTPKPTLHWARLAGRVALGLVLGLALAPALLELAALASNVSPFKYQGF